MKKIFAISLAVCLVVSLACVFSSAVTLNRVENICTYTVPLVTGYGLEWYNDYEGEQDLFDGVIPDEELLDEAVAEAIEEDETLNEWYAWKGWTALAKTVPADAYEYNKSVNVDFEFSRSIALKEMVFYTAAMSTGNVGNPSMYYIYVSDDGENYTREAVATMEGGGEANEPVLAQTTITLDEGVHKRSGDI